MIKKSSFVKNPIYRELNFTLPWDLTDGISSLYATNLDGLTLSQWGKTSTYMELWYLNVLNNQTLIPLQVFYTCIRLSY